MDSRSYIVCVFSFLQIRDGGKYKEVQEKQVCGESYQKKKNTNANARLNEVTIAQTIQKIFKRNGHI